MTPGDENLSQALSGRQDPFRSLETLAKSFAATAERHDREASLPVANLKALHRAGFLALTAPQTFGGAGRGLEDAVRVVGALGRAEPATGLITAMQYISLASLAESRCSPTLKRETLGAASDQGALLNALRVEPDLGTPWRGGLPATILRRTEDGWRLSGRKIYSTGAGALTWGVVWARTDEEPPRVGNVLVPLAATGVRIHETWDHLGLRASGSHDVIFDDVRVPEDHAADLRSPEEWAAAPDAIGAVWVSVLLAALYDGVARAAQAWTIGFLRTRAPSNLGAPLASLPLPRHAVGENEAQLAIHRRLLLSVGRDWDRDRSLNATEAGQIKVAVTEGAVAVVERALRLTGNHGLSRANPLERHHRDVLCGRIHSPQGDMVFMNAGGMALAEND
ncbi:acyl-CoA dehydrogenase family protein [Methylopila henanensis]|uniref:Acyl-CoA dehydrogenase family protein n=1 Tax=Methylopila henanensis TaxID=873516 RepID=A0ABW4K7C1_9HYPH